MSIFIKSIPIVNVNPCFSPQKDSFGGFYKIFAILRCSTQSEIMENSVKWSERITLFWLRIVGALKQTLIDYVNTTNSSLQLVTLLDDLFKFPSELIW